jgi:hypothetical protein
MPALHVYMQRANSEGRVGGGEGPCAWSKLHRRSTALSEHSYCRGGTTVVESEIGSLRDAANAGPC